jgi:hypothetical protein
MCRDQLSPGESVSLQKPMVDEIGRFHKLPGPYWCDVVDEVNSPTMAGSDARVELMLLNPTNRLLEESRTIIKVLSVLEPSLRNPIGDSFRTYGDKKKTIQTRRTAMLKRLGQQRLSDRVAGSLFESPAIR